MSASTDFFNIALQDSHKNAVIHTYDPKHEHELNLIFTPIKSSSFTIPALSGPASKTNFHFAISFGSKVLSDTKDSPVLSKAYLAKGWQKTVSNHFDIDTGLLVSNIYLVNNKGLTVDAGDSLTIGLVYENAVSKGTNTTTEVTVEINSIVIPNDKSGKNKFRGPYYLILVNSAPIPYLPLPLHIGFSGPRTVFNNDSENSLTLEFTNLLKAKTLKLDARSYFELSFDEIDITGDTTLPNYSWALSTYEKVAEINFSSPTGWNSSKNKPTLPQNNPVKDSNTWTIKPLAKNTGMEANGQVRFQITNIKTDLAPGLTNLYVRYYNIPDYGNGMIVVQLEKSPMRYNDYSNTGVTVNSSAKYNTAGIGINNSDSPGTAISVHQTGKSTGDAIYVEQQGTGHALNVYQKGDGNAALVTQESDSNAITVDQVGNGNAIQVNQKSNGYAMKLIKSGDGKAFCITQSGAGDAMQIDQKGTGKAAIFKGGSGVNINTIGNGATGLTVQCDLNPDQHGINIENSGGNGIGLCVNQKGANNSGEAVHIIKEGTKNALGVYQKGTGNAALFEGGMGVEIKNITNKKNGLTVNSSAGEHNAGIGVTNSDSKGTGVTVLQTGTSTGDAIYVEQHGTGHALNLVQNGDGNALNVKQDGIGKSAVFSGGKGVSISAGENVTELSEPALKIEAHNLNMVKAALEVSANGSSAAHFIGGSPAVKIDGGLMIDGGLKVFSTAPSPSPSFPSLLTIDGFSTFGKGGAPMSQIIAGAVTVDTKTKNPTIAKGVGFSVEKTSNNGRECIRVKFDTEFINIPVVTCSINGSGKNVANNLYNHIVTCSPAAAQADFFFETLQFVNSSDLCSFAFIAIGVRDPK